ncbi:MAG: hypothetical protein PHT54_02985 [Candidatus Nanoarchaeia archaeon]|nr:hypothetical protein [Candidatus Nanoarchaeia archaeon]
MKRVFFLIALLVLVSPVFAGKLSSIDFKENKEQIVVLNERDAVKFIIDYRDYSKPFITPEGKEQINFEILKHEETIKIDKVSGEKVSLAIFIEGAEVPTYIGIDKEHDVKLDFERDFVDDVDIHLISVSDKQVSLRFNLLERDGDPDLKVIAEQKGWYANETETKEEIPETSSSWYKDWKVILAVVLILIIIFLNKRLILRGFRKLRRNLR